MQFSVVALITALAATASASYVPANATTVPYYPTGTSAPSGTVPAPTSSFTQTPFEGAASRPEFAGSALALIIAGGVALMY